MSSSELADFWVDTVAVQTYTGVTGSGVKQYAASQNVPGFLEGKRRLVRGPDGNQVISESTLYADSSYASTFTTGSLVTVPDRPKPTTVLAVNVNDSGDLDLPDHVAVALQ